LDDARQFRHVLRIFDDRQPLCMLVRLHARETFEHLKTCQLEAACVSVKVGENGAPNRMRMQDGSGTACAYYSQMQCGLIRRLALPCDHLACRVDLQQLCGDE